MESKAQLTQTLLTVNLFNEQYEQEESDEREYRYENFIFIKMFHVFGIILFSHCTAQKIKFSFKEFFSKCDQIRSKLRIWSDLLKKFLMKKFIFCAVLG